MGEWSSLLSTHLAEWLYLGPTSTDFHSCSVPHPQSHNNRYYFLRCCDVNQKIILLLTISANISLDRASISSTSVIPTWVSDLPILAGHQLPCPCIHQHVMEHIENSTYCLALILWACLWIALLIALWFLLKKLRIAVCESTKLIQLKGFSYVLQKFFQKIRRDSPLHWATLHYATSAQQL